MMLDDIKVFEEFWRTREKQHTPKNWAISAFHLGMEVQNQKKQPCNQVVEDGQAKDYECSNCGLVHISHRPIKCFGCKTPAT